MEEEGCLSIPGPYYPTRRHSRIRCRGQDLAGDPVEIDGGGSARADLPARDRPPGRNAVHRPAERGRSQGRARRAPPHRVGARRASPTTSRRRGVGDARAHLAGAPQGGVHGQRRVVGPDARAPRSRRHRRRGARGDEPAAPRGSRIRAHADTGRGRRSPTVASRSRRSRRRATTGSWRELRALDPDVSVVVAYGELLAGDVLDVPRLGSVNLHFSLLPRWRGREPGPARAPRRRRRHGRHRDADGRGHGHRSGTGPAGGADPVGRRRRLPRRAPRDDRRRRGRGDAGSPRGRRRDADAAGSAPRRGRRSSGPPTGSSTGRDPRTPSCVACARSRPTRARTRRSGGPT